MIFLTCKDQFIHQQVHALLLKMDNNGNGTVEKDEFVKKIKTHFGIKDEV